MSAVGSVSVAMGLFIVCTRCPLVVAPAAWLRWFGGLIRTNGGVRKFGAFIVLLSTAMVGAGTTDDSTLAVILTVWGLAGFVVGPVSIAFPEQFRRFATGFLPSVGGSLFGWRLLGVVGVVVGLLLIYFGVLAF